MGVRVRVRFKDCVGVLHCLGGEGCYVGRGMKNKFSGAFGAIMCLAGGY